MDALEGRVVVLEHEARSRSPRSTEREQLRVGGRLDQPHLRRPASRSRKRRISSGRIRAPALWNVPTRSVPPSPVEHREHVGLRPRFSRARIASACRSTSLPASVSDTAARPPGRSISLHADDLLERRDLLADRRLRVAEPAGRAAEVPVLGDRLERRQMTNLDAHQATMVCDRNVHYLAFYESVGRDDAVGMKRFDLEFRVLLAFAFVNGVAESSFVPLLPSVRSALGLTSVETGVLLTTTTLAMLAAAMPIGYAANRFGTRVPLLVATVVMPLGLLAQAVAGGLGPLLAARLLFGVSFGILWVIGPARAAANGRGAGGTGR